MADHGTVFKTRFKQMREQIEAMKAIWTKSEPEYHGEIVDFPKMRTWPKPVQKPHPPVIVGGAFPHSARRAIRYGDGWVPEREPRALCRRDRVPAAVPPDGGRCRARAGCRSGVDIRRAGGSRSAKALPRSGHRARGRQRCPRPRPTRSCPCSTAGPS